MFELPIHVLLNIVIILALDLMLVIVFSRAYLAGLTVARAAGAEETPDGLWASFNGVFWPRIRQWWPLYLAYLILPPAIDLWTRPYSIWTARTEQLLIALDYLIPQIGMAFIIISGCSIWAPYCRRIWSLATMTIFTCLVFAFGWDRICEKWFENKTELTTGPFQFSFSNLGLLVTAAIVLIVLTWWQRRGIKWFRISTRTPVMDMR